MLKSVLFDLDGTLIDTAPDFTVAVNTLRRQHHLAPLAADTIARQVSNGSVALTELAMQLKPNEAGFETYREQLLAHYREIIGQHATLYSGLDDLLARLDNSGIKWGIVTNKPLRFTEPLLAALDLAPRCAVLVCPEHVTHSKPHPEALLYALTILGHGAEHSVYIGDHHRDITAGRNADLHTIAARYGYIEASDDVTTWQANDIAERPSDLYTIIDRLQTLSAAL